MLLSYGQQICRLCWVYHDVFFGLDASVSRYDHSRRHMACRSWHCPADSCTSPELASRRSLLCAMLPPQLALPPPELHSGPYCADKGTVLREIVLHSKPGHRNLFLAIPATLMLLVVLSPLLHSDRRRHAFGSCVDRRSIPCCLSSCRCRLNPVARSSGSVRRCFYELWRLEIAMDVFCHHAAARCR